MNNAAMCFYRKMRHEFMPESAAATAPEYAVHLLLTLMAVIGTVTLLGSNVTSTCGSIGDHLDIADAQPSGPNQLR